MAGFSPSPMGYWPEGLPMPYPGSNFLNHASFNNLYQMNPNWIAPGSEPVFGQSLPATTPNMNEYGLGTNPQPSGGMPMAFDPLWQGQVNLKSIMYGSGPSFGQSLPATTPNIPGTLNMQMLPDQAPSYPGQLPTQTMLLSNQPPPPGHIVQQQWVPNQSAMLPNQPPPPQGELPAQTDMLPNQPPPPSGEVPVQSVVKELSKPEKEKQRKQRQKHRKLADPESALQNAMLPNERPPPSQTQVPTQPALEPNQPPHPGHGPNWGQPKAHTKREHVHMYTLEDLQDEVETLRARIMELEGSHTTLEGEAVAQRARIAELVGQAQEDACSARTHAKSLRELSQSMDANMAKRDKRKRGEKSKKSAAPSSLVK